MLHKLIIYISLSFSSVLAAQPHTNHFSPGERLRFVINYGFIDAGIVEAELNAVVFNDNEAYHARMLARSIGLADKFYRVRDEYQSFFNPVTLLPYRSIRDISEGRYKRYHMDTFFHGEGKVITTTGEAFEIPPYARDMVTVFFYIRNLDFSVMQDGDLIKIVTFFDDRSGATGAAQELDG